MVSQTDKEMIAVRLDALCSSMDQLNQNLCCLRTPQLVEVGRPVYGIPFHYFGEIPQLNVQNTQVFIFSVPQGHTGVINQFSFTEHYVGSMYGASFTLMINGAATNEFGRVGHNVGTPELPQTTWIALKEGDQVSLLVNCPWLPSNFRVETATTVHMTWHFNVWGYFLDKEAFASLPLPNEGI